MWKTSMIALALTGAAILAGCQGGAHPDLATWQDPGAGEGSTVPQPGATSPGSFTAEELYARGDVFAGDMLAAVNGQRTAMGVAPLRWNAVLAQASRDYAQDMWAQDFFSHTGLDGSSPGDRALRAGYEGSAVGENIARGFTTLQSVMNGWMNSPPHRENILNPDWTEMGAGVVPTNPTPGNSRWVQKFGRGGQAGEGGPNVNIPDGTPPAGNF